MSLVQATHIDMLYCLSHRLIIGETPIRTLHEWYCVPLGKCGGIY